MTRVQKIASRPQWFILSGWDYTVMGISAIVLIFMIIFPFWDKQNRAVQYILLKQYSRAADILKQALDFQVFSPALRMNLALSYFLAGQYELALREYEITSRLANKTHIPWAGEEPLDFYISFNSAVTESQQQNIPQALSFYQQALKTKPLSLETKVNIELLTQSHKTSGKKNTDKKEKNQKTPSQNQEKDASSKSRKEEQQNQKNEQQSQKSHPEVENKPLSSDLSGEKDKQTSQRQKLLNARQMEAVLKSIQQQEKFIQEQRNQKHRRHSSPSSQRKDW